ncbi:hypothetical protein ACJRO7_004253 [Eucalyptus globulus]|uniref:Uncharacterized protein n=1 Tax=Eucalyptus globulus TaxID=34317 RepID=A0ABD3IW80_EUCGL
MANTLIMNQGETDFNSLGLAGLDFFDVGKGLIIEASKWNESHSSGYLRMGRKGVELEVLADMFCGAREVGLKKPQAARSSDELMDEAAMMDCGMMGTAGIASPNLRGRLEIRIELGLNLYKDEQNKYKSRDAESYKQDAPINASQGIEGSCGCTDLESIKGRLKEGEQALCLISCIRSYNRNATDISIRRRPWIIYF